MTALKAAVDFCKGEGLPFAETLEALYDKLTAPFKPRKEGPDMQRAEAILVKAAPDVILPVEGANPGWWASLSARCADRGITDEQLVCVGRWLGSQPWARGMTTDRVMAGWPSYLARAKADMKGGHVYGSIGRTDWSPDNT